MKTREFYTRAKKTLYETDEFFSDVKKEKGIRNALKYFSIFTLIFLLFMTYYYLHNLNALMGMVANYLGEPPLPTIEINLQTFIMFYIGFAAFIILFAFARYYFIHIFVRLFNRKAKYQETYKALSYSTTPGYLGAPFLLASFLLFGFLNQWWAWIVFVPSTIIYVSCEVYSVYMRSRALSIVQDISLLKALLCIYILGFITLLLAVMLVEVIVIVLAALIISII